MRLSLGISNVSTLFFVSGGPFAGRLRHDLVALIAGYSYLITGFVGPAAAPSPGPCTPGPKCEYIRTARTRRYGESGRKVHPQNSETIPVRSRREDLPIGAVPRRAAPLAGLARSISIGTEISIRDIEISCAYIAPHHGYLDSTPGPECLASSTRSDAKFIHQDLGRSNREQTVSILMSNKVIEDNFKRRYLPCRILKSIAGRHSRRFF